MKTAPATPNFATLPDLTNAYDMFDAAKTGVTAAFDAVAGRDRTIDTGYNIEGEVALINDTELAVISHKMRTTATSQTLAAVTPFGLAYVVGRFETGEDMPRTYRGYLANGRNTVFDKRLSTGDKEVVKVATAGGGDKHLRESITNYVWQSGWTGRLETGKYRNNGGQYNLELAGVRMAKSLVVARLLASGGSVEDIFFLSERHIDDVNTRLKP